MFLPKNEVKPSTRHHAVDEPFAAILSEDFGIQTRVILSVLEAEPQKQAISVCGWAERTDDPAHALRCWSKKHRKGRCRRAGTTAARPSRKHADISGSPGGDRRDDGRASGPDRPGGIDPAFVRANVARMGG